MWYCHEEKRYLLCQANKAYNSQLSCIKNAKKHGYSEEVILSFFLHISYIQKKARYDINHMIGVYCKTNISLLSDIPRIYQ